MTQLLGWSNMNNLTIINSSENFSIVGLLNENRSIEYNLSYSNYGIYFSLFAHFSNSSELSYKNLEKYFKIEYKYSRTGYDNDKLDLESEECNERKINEFLNLDYNKTKVTETETNPWRICIKDNLNMGLLTEKKMETVFTPAIFLEVKQCKNTTENNNSCASFEEIKEIRKFITIQSTLPKTIYDFKNQSNLIKRVYQVENHNLDLNLKKIIKTELNPTHLYKDWGLFYDNYKLDSTNFNQGQQTIDFDTKDEKDELLFQYQIYFSYQIDNYFIRNQKIHEILGSFGGIISIFYSLGNFLCFYINRILFTNYLVYLAFKINNTKSKEKRVFPTK
jgi:hypothetical protein